MYLLKKKLEHKKPYELTNDEKGMLAIYENPVDWTDKKAINPIVELINNSTK